MAKDQRDIGLLTKDERLKERIKTICKEFSYSIEVWPTLDNFMDADTECRLVLFQLSDKPDKQELAKEAVETAQVVSQASGGGYLIGIMSKVLARDDMIFLRKSGLDIVMNPVDVYETSKIEFIMTQVLRAQFVPIKEVDLIAGKPVDFDLYHLMPMNQKFLKIVKKGGEITEKKLEKMREVGEFYIHRSALGDYTTYLSRYPSNSKSGELRDCRGQFMEFYKKFIDLVGILTDPSQFISYEAGKKLLDECNNMVKALASSLAKVGVGDVWDVINNSVVGDFGSLERSTAIAAYVAYFGIKMNYMDIENIIFAALICDLGLICLPPSITSKLRSNLESELTRDEKERYHRYPYKSLEIILGQKLPVGPEIKDIVMKCHEHSDGSGFPAGLSSTGLSKASQLLGFCWIFDQKTILRMGQQRIDRDKVLKEVISEELTNLSRFTPLFLIELKKYFG